METTQSLETLCHFYYNGVYVGRLVNANKPTLLTVTPGGQEGVDEEKLIMVLIILMIFILLLRRKWKTL